jgi:hypothetical protein
MLVGEKIKVPVSLVHLAEEKVEIPLVDILTATESAPLAVPVSPLNIINGEI